MPVREAFKRLTSEGALEPMSTGATRVPVFDLEKLQDLLEIRLMVEGFATRRAATRISEQEYEAIHAANAEVLRAARAGDVAAEARANERFHFSIYRAARSEELLRIIEHLWLQMGPYLLWLLRHGRWPSHSRGRAAFRYHKQVLLAIRRRDGVRAEAALRADLTSAGKVLMDQVQQIPKPAE
jgi:DNA-binding GntR family transcriptional regulator